MYFYRLLLHSRCDTYFCYLCEAKLPRANPYAHFSSPNTTCYNQLFQGIEMDDGGGGWEQLGFQDENDEEDVNYWNLLEDVEVI